MGVVLYLKSFYQRQQDESSPQFRYWEAGKKALREAGKIANPERASRQVIGFFEMVRSRGYFRDGYRGAYLLGLFDLSWQRDVEGELIDENRTISPKAARRFLGLLWDREPVFEANLRKLEATTDEALEEIEKYFRSKYGYLKQLLQDSISRNESIVCSL
jgi:hypothetical protein